MTEIKVKQRYTQDVVEDKTHESSYETIDRLEKENKRLWSVFRFTVSISQNEMAMDLVKAKEKIVELQQQNEKLRQEIWDIVGECMTGITDAEKISQIETILLDSEDIDSEPDKMTLNDPNLRKEKL